eukprot:5278153-Alexandrium_andersonii.AAC.1
MGTSRSAPPAIVPVLRDAVACTGGPASSQPRPPVVGVAKQPASRGTAGVPRRACRPRRLEERPAAPE